MVIMSQERVSISIPEQLAATIRAQADANGETVSAWAARALEERAAHETRIAEGLAAMAEHQEAVGRRFTEEELAAAHQELVEVGVIPAGASDHPLAS